MKMKVVKINKMFRSGSNEHFLVLFESYPNDEIDYLVEDWCESDLSGSNYGYHYGWTFVEDEELINTILKDKMKIIENKIEKLKNEATVI